MSSQSKEIGRVAAVALLSAILLTLGACGGGGGGGTSISASPRSVHFTAEQDAPLPASADVTIRYSGAGVEVGYPPDGVVPQWLDVSAEGTVAGQGVIHLSVNTTDIPPPATLTTTLRAVVGNASGGDLKYVDIAITYAVTGAALNIMATPGQLQFSGLANGPSPAAQSVMLTYDGDNVAVDPASVPGWLQVVQQSAGNGRAVYALQPSATGLTPGTLTAGVTFTTSRGANPVTAVVQISFQVLAPLSVSPESMSFTLVKSSGQQPAPSDLRSFNISGDDLEWTAAADQPWVGLMQASGSGPATVQFILDGGSLSLGDQKANITVSNTTTGETRKIALDVDVVAPKLVISPAMASISIDAQTTPAEAQAVLQVTDQINGQDSSLKNQWSVSGISVPWLAASPSSGQVPPNGSVTVKAVPSQIGTLSNGVHTGTVTLQYTNADSSGTINIPVTLNLTLPSLTYIAPYIGTAAVSREVVLRGSGLTKVTAGQVQFGSTAGNGFSVVNDSEIHVNNPALPAGTFKVSIVNNLGATTQSANFTVLAPQVYASAAVPTRDRKKRLIYDAERQMLYAADDENYSLVRFRYSSGTWTQEFLSTPSLVHDIAMSPDGRSLILATEAGMYQADLTKEPLQFAGPYAANTFEQGFNFPGVLQAANDGRAVVMDDCYCSSVLQPTYIYDSVAHTAVGLNLPSAAQTEAGLPVAARSANGDAIYLGSENDSIGFRYNSATGTVDQLQFSDYVQGLAVSRNGNRIALDSLVVYDSHAAVLGYIHGRSFSVSMTPDEATLYSVDFPTNSSAPQNLLAYDLTQPVDGSGNFQIKQSTPLTTDPGEYYANDLLTLVSEDGNTLFISGTQYLLVVPLSH